MPAASGHSYTEEGGASPVPGGSWLAQVSFFLESGEVPQYCHYTKYCRYFNCLVLLIIKSHLNIVRCLAPVHLHLPEPLGNWSGGSTSPVPKENPFHGEKIIQHFLV